MSNTFSPTEYPIIRVHQTPWVFVPYLAIPVACGLILMLVVGLPGWLVIAAASVGPLIRFATWRRRTYTLTNERLICRHGLLIQVEQVYWLNRLQRYTERSSWLGLHLGGFADLEIHATGGSVTLRQIHRFIDFQNALLSLV
jgi:uncharacterized membrane protein YdbT with pleckstrin-like domain